MGVIVPFPLEQRPALPDPAQAPNMPHSAGAEIIILPVVRIERMDVTPPRLTPTRPKKPRKRA